MTQKLLLALPAALSLAACGGGGGDEATTTPAQAQYSYTTSSPNWTTTLPATLSVYAEQDGTNVTSSQKVANVDIKQWNATRGEPDQVDIQIDGKVITLTYDPATREMSGTHDGKNYYFGYFSNTQRNSNQTETVAAQVIIVVGDANTNTISEIAQGVIGFETPDSVVAAATGTANYSGGGTIRYLTANAWEISETQANFAVDFNTSTISGAINVDAPTTSSGSGSGPVTYSFATISVPPTALTGNGFSAQPTVTVNNPGANTYTFSNETINGTFYGDSSDVLAGTLSADYTVNGTAGVAVGDYLAN
ncbi:transferrin-binding protein-like solute binding protein [Planktomarina temperata]|nr:transferrin-binding protein-like solute binding protein [Planktomarina temperata]